MAQKLPKKKRKKKKKRKNISKTVNIYFFVWHLIEEMVSDYDAHQIIIFFSPLVQPFFLYQPIFGVSAHVNSNHFTEK